MSSACGGEVDIIHRGQRRCSMRSDWYKKLHMHREVIAVLLVVVDKPMTVEGHQICTKHVVAGKRVIL